MPGDPISFFNRHSGRLEQESIYGEGFLRAAYENPIGRLVVAALIKRAAFSRWYGRRMDQPASRSRIAPFIEHYHLDPAEFADSPDSFATFNDFFSRRLNPAARPIDPNPASVVFPADGRHLGFARADQINSVFVKGQQFNLPALLGSHELAAKYAAGSLILSRLCPVDYHRFHFPCAGTPGTPTLLDGQLYSVSPIALRRRLAYLWENKRVLTRLETDRFGTVLLLEIGATNVGSIVQSMTPGQPVAKGAEKGMFRFGGSSTITIFEPGRVTLADDLLAHSAQCRELYARMGSPMASA